jgi:hypothetical protein
MLADCIPEREEFSRLLQADGKKRIVIFQGESGTGKTSLLKACLENLPEYILHVPLNFKGGAISVSEILSRTGSELSWERLVNFRSQVAELSKTPHITVDGNRLIGINNKITVALEAESPKDLEERRVALTDAWFEDIHSINNVILISIDTFEQATLETFEWISGPFLYRAARSKNLRVLLAGQKVPDHHEHASEWGNCCTAFQLVGIENAELWDPVIKLLGYVIPAEHPEDFMKGICKALKGKPSEIMKMIEGFPRAADRL